MKPSGTIETDRTSREASLVRRALAGDADSFGSLVEAHQRGVYALLLARVGRCEVARDLAQETFVRAWLGLGRLTGAEAFAPWLYGIARHLAVDYHRRNREFVNVEEAMRGANEDSPLIIPPPDPDRLAVRRRVAEAVAALPEKTREAVLLFYLDERSLSEIAVLLHAPLGAIRSRLDYGRKKLKKELLDMMKESLRETSPGPEFKGKVLEHVAGIKSTSPYLSSLAQVFRYRVRRINEHVTTRALTDEILSVRTGDAFRFYFGTDASVRFLCSRNLLVSACESFGLSYRWEHDQGFDASWKILRAAIDEGSPAVVAYRPSDDSSSRWINLPNYATWGLVVGYDPKTRAAVVAPAGRMGASHATEIVPDFPDRWEGWSPGPEGWVKYPVFVPGEPAPERPAGTSVYERAAEFMEEGEVTIAGKKMVGGVAGLEKWAAFLRDGREIERAEASRLTDLAAATLEMVWTLRPSRKAAALRLFESSARQEEELKSLLRDTAGLFLDVAESLSFELEEVLTETPEIRDNPEHEVSHLQVTEENLRDPRLRTRGAEIIDSIAIKEREALHAFRRIITLTKKVS